MTARDAWTAAFLVGTFAPVVVRLFASAPGERNSHTSARARLGRPTTGAPLLLPDPHRHPLRRL